MRNFFGKYPILFSAIALILVSFPDVIFLKSSFMVVDHVPFDGSSAYVDSEGRSKLFPLYPETKKNVVQGFFDAGGALWQSEPKIPYMKYVIQNGENPFWNPYQGAGSLGPETMIDVKFSPVMLLAALLGGHSLATNFTILFFLGLGSYFLIKLCVTILELPLIAGIAAALAYLFNGYQSSSLANNYAQSYLLFPLLLYALFALVKQGSLARFILAYCAVAAILCITFMPTTASVVIATAFLAAGYALQQDVSLASRLRKIVLIGIAMLCGLILVAFIYLPLAQALALTPDMDAYAERVFYPVTLNGLLSLFTPKHLWNSYVTMNPLLFAHPDSSAFTGNNAIFHIGLTGGLLALCTLHAGMWKRPLVIVTWFLVILMLLRLYGIALYSHPENPAFLGNVILRLGFAGGIAAVLWSLKPMWKKPIFIPVWGMAVLILLRLAGIPWYDRLFNIIPVIGKFGTQYIWITIMICLPLLVAYGMEAVIRGLSLHRRARGFLAFIFILLVFLLLTLPFEILNGQKAVHLLAFSLFCAVIYWIGKLATQDQYRRAIPVLLLLLLFAEYGYYLNHARPERTEIYRQPPDYVSYIKTSIGHQRILNLGQYGLPAEQPSAFQIQDVSIMAMNVSAAYQNLYLNHLVPDKYKFFTHLTFLQAKDTAELNVNLTSFLGVKYMVVQKDWPVWNAWLTKNFKLVFETKSIAVYENPFVWPRAFFTSATPPKLTVQAVESGVLSRKEVIPAQITSYHHANVSISVDAPMAGVLVLTDNWHPHWLARVNGAPTEVKKVFQAFRGVAVPKGHSEVVFYYRNPAVLWGIRISGIFALLTLGLSLILSASSHLKNKRSLSIG